MLCEAYVDYFENRRIVLNEGYTYISETRYGATEQPRPEVRIMEKAFDRVRKMLIEFGLTPSARAKVSMIDEAEGTEAESFFD